MKEKKTAKGEKWRTSGSKRRMVPKERFAETRNKKELELDGVPVFRGIKDGAKFYNGKVNINYLFRFLQKSIGKNWNEVHSLLLKKIPKGILGYGDIISWLVADETEIKGKKVWDKKKHRYLGFENFKSFYVHPETGKLKWVKRATVKKRETFDLE